MIAATMQLHNSNHHRVCRCRRWPGAVRASARAALTAWAAAVALAAASAAQACGYHDPASTSLGMLNWAYPDAMHVRTAVWMAQASGVLPRREPLLAADPLSTTFRLEQLMRLRDTQAALGELRHRIDTGLAGQPMPAFAMLMIGPMLWARFDSTSGSVNMVLHATGPVGDDVVIVTDEVVVAALAEGRLTAREARAQGLVKTYGTRQSVERISVLLDRSFELKENPMSQTQASQEAP
jgi:hypothetical protein